MKGTVKRVKMEAGAYELIDNTGRRFKVEHVFDPEAHGVEDVWKLFVAKRPDADFWYDFDWEWNDTFHRLRDAVHWVQAVGPIVDWSH
jgi:hypothetical protein